MRKPRPESQIRAIACLTRKTRLDRLYNSHEPTVLRHIACAIEEAEERAARKQRGQSDLLYPPPEAGGE